MWVNGNWPVTFRFVDDVELVDYQYYMVNWRIH